MADFPRLHTERLLLRAFVPADAPHVERLAGARQVAEMTLAIPHPYPPGAGAEWIATHADAWTRQERLTLAIARRDQPECIFGGVGLHLANAHRRAELGYWLGMEHWGLGYATEAARALVAYAFAELGLHRVEARYFTRNAASGRVLQKLGMRPEGVHRDACMRWGRFEDVAMCAILASEWNGNAEEAIARPR